MTRLDANPSVGQTPDSEPEATGFCLHCGAALLRDLRWCGDRCMSIWAGLGASYAVCDGDRVTITDTDSDGRKLRAWFTRIS